jgi:hypothetical protein
MKFSSFITIALLALIAYALLRPAPSPNAMQEILRLAQQLIPPATPARTGGADFHPADEQPLPAPGSSAQGFPPGTQQPNLTPQAKAPANGRLRPQAQLTWDPLAPKGEDQATRRQYTGWVREHLSGDCLLIRCGTRLRADSGPEGEYVLAGFPDAAKANVDSQIDFYAYSGGVVTYDNDTETKTISILLYSSAIGQMNEAPIQSPQQPLPPPGHTEPPKGSWMWQGNSPLNRGPYNQKVQ